MSGLRNIIQPPPAQTPIEVYNERGQVAGRVFLQRNMTWFDWLNSIFFGFEQWTMSGSLNFGNTNAQTSAELTITIAITGVTVPVTSFLVMHEPVSPPANTCFTARMTAENEITVKFNNYSAGAINPASLDFDFLIIPKKA